MFDPMKRTPLFEAHEELGARMVEFAGYSMPLHYQAGINQEHLTVRQGVGLFDVSHMGEVRVVGPAARSCRCLTTAAVFDALATTR